MLLLGNALVLLFLGALSQQGIVFFGSLLVGDNLGKLHGAHATTALERDGSDEALDLGALDARLATFLLAGDDALDNVLADIVFLGQVEELANLASTLGTQTAGNGSISQTGQVSIALLDNDQAQDSQVVSDNAATDALALAFTVTASTIAALTLGEEQANTVVQQDTLLHGETLLVVTTGDLENVALEFFTQGITFDFLGDALVHEGAQLAFIIDFNELLATSGRVSNVKL